MKIRLILIFISLTVILTSAFVWASSPNKNLAPSKYNIGISYESAMQKEKPFIAMFYVDWCSYCKKFMPEYKLLSKVYENKYNFVMINAEESVNNKIVNDYAIGGFPTVYIIDPVIDNRVLINNTIYDNPAKLRIELDRYLRIRRMIKLNYN